MRLNLGNVWKPRPGSTCSRMRAVGVWSTFRQKSPPHSGDSRSFVRLFACNVPRPVEEQAGGVLYLRVWGVVDTMVAWLVYRTRCRCWEG
jgi:hypothetical protein